jgi:hypothetical protein
MSMARPASWFVPGVEVGSQGGDDDAVVAADPRECGDQSGVDPAGAQIGALDRREDDPRVAEDLSQERRVDGELGSAAARRAAVDGGLGQDVGDVPVGVVVGEDRGAVVAGRAGGSQVAGGGGDRVAWVVGVLPAVAVSVDAVRAPGGGVGLIGADPAG